MDDRELLMQIKDEIGNLNTRLNTLFPPGTPYCQTHEFRLKSLERWKWGFIAALVSVTTSVVGFFIKGGTPHG